MGTYRKELKQQAFIDMLRGMGFIVDALHHHVKWNNTSVVKRSEKGGYLFWNSVQTAQQQLMHGWFPSVGFQATFLKAIKHDETLLLTPIARAVIMEKVRQFNRSWKRKKGERK